MKNIFKLILVVVFTFLFGCQSRARPDAFAVLASSYTKGDGRDLKKSNNIKGYIFSATPLKTGSKIFIVLNHGGFLKLSDSNYSIGKEITFTDVLNERDESVPLNDSVQKVSGWKYIYRGIPINKPEMEADENLLVLVANKSVYNISDSLSTKGVLKDKNFSYEISFNCEKSVGMLKMSSVKMKFDYFCGDH